LFTGVIEKKIRKKLRNKHNLKCSFFGKYKVNIPRQILYKSISHWTLSNFTYYYLMNICICTAIYYQNKLKQCVLFVCYCRYGV